MLILILEDNKAIRDMLKMALTRAGYAALEARDVATAKALLGAEEVDLAIVDWMLPDLPGTDFIRWVRRQAAHKTLPIIMLTAKTQAEDTVKGLDAGADDYLSKPVGIPVLLARIRALGRRPKVFNSAAHTLAFAQISINTLQRQLTVNEKPVKIKSAEYKLLCFLVQHPNRVWTRSQLLDRVWGQSAYLDERTIDVHVLRLRKALKPHGVDKLIVTVRGAGYQMTKLNNEN